MNISNGKYNIWKYFSYKDRHDILFFHRLDTKSDFIVGDDIINLHPDAPYNIHFPFKRGDINVHNDVGGSKTAVLANLETIWTYAVENHLGIPRRDFCHFKAVVVIPALYKRTFVKHYMSLALGQLGFGHTFVLQDHVAATFGAGLGNYRILKLIFDDDGISINFN